MLKEGIRVTLLWIWHLLLKDELKLVRFELKSQIQLWASFLCGSEKNDPYLSVPHF